MHGVGDEPACLYSYLSSYLAKCPTKKMLNIEGEPEQFATDHLKCFVCTESYHKSSQTVTCAAIVCACVKGALYIGICGFLAVY